MDNTKKSNGTAIVVSFLIGALVGFGGFRLWTRWEERASVIEGFPQNSEETEKFEQPFLTEGGESDTLPSSFAGANGENNLNVSNQVAGNKVDISSVTLSVDGWVAIHEDNDGKPSKILGARLFRAGTNKGSVELLRNTLPGKIYYAMLHGENGDGKFDLTSDSPLKGPDSSPIMKQFKTEGVSLN